MVECAGQRQLWKKALFSASFPATGLFQRRQYMYGKKTTMCIRVYPLPQRPSQYVATFHSDVLDATFSVTFRETITGSVGLHTFAEMI